MKRTIIAATAAVTMMAGLGVWAVAAQATDSGKRTFTLELHQTTMHVVDQPPADNSAGDMVVLAGDMSRDGKDAGKYQGYCVQIDSGDHSECTFTLAQPEGQLVIAAGYGPGINGDAVVQEPIVGGTGVYAKARGHAEGRETGEDTIHEVIHLED